MTCKEAAELFKLYAVATPKVSPYHDELTAVAFILEAFGDALVPEVLKTRWPLVWTCDDSPPEKVERWKALFRAGKIPQAR